MDNMDTFENENGEPRCLKCGQVAEWLECEDCEETGINSQTDLLCTECSGLKGNYYCIDCDDYTQPVWELNDSNN